MTDGGELQRLIDACPKLVVLLCAARLPGLNPFGQWIPQRFERGMYFSTSISSGTDKNLLKRLFQLCPPSPWT